MEEIIKQLKPIERLYLISQEREEVYNKKNKTFCLLFSLINNQSLKVSSNSKNLTVNWNTKEYPTPYESEVLSLINDKKFLELNDMIDTKLFFKKTLLDTGLFKEEIGIKKILFIKLADNKLVKTHLYHKLQSHYLEKLDSKVPILNLVCEKSDLFNKTKQAYTALKVNMLDMERKVESEELKENSKENKKE